MNIFVACSSRDVKNPNYNNIADKIGKFIGDNNYTLVFGGCSFGLMGRVYTAAKESGAKVIATQARVYAEELKGLDLDELVILENINDRKKCYKEYADVMVILPGGLGTLDEFTDSLETRRADEHKIPIIMVNSNGLYDGALQNIDRMIEENLLSASVKDLFHVVSNADEAIEVLKKMN